MSTKAKSAATGKRKAPGAAKGVKRKRRPRFNPNEPSALLNLSEVWRYRDGLQRNLQKYEDRLVDDDLSEDDKKKAANNAKRYKRDLRQLAEHQKDLSDTMKSMMEYSLALGRLEESEERDVIEQYVGHMSESLTYKTPPKAAGASGAAADDADDE